MARSDQIRRRKQDEAASGAATLEDLIPVRVARITEIFSRIAAASFTDRLGIRVTDLRILNVLHEGDEVSVAEISRRARIDRAWIGRLVRELEDKNLVARTPDPEDRRSALVSLTANGRAVRRQLLPISSRYEQLALAGVDRAHLVTLLDRIEANCLDVIRALEADQGMQD